MKNLRLLHRYMGLLFSPAILFFAFSGTLQVFDLHSPNRSTGYIPPAWLVEIAQLHKKQTLSLPKGKSKAVQPESGDPEVQKKETKATKSSLPLKCFVLAMSVGLMVTTFLGIYMSFRLGGERRLAWAMLVAGTLLPVAMIFF